MEQSKIIDTLETYQTVVTSQEGKVKRQWTVAMVHEEAPGERTVATEVTH